MKDNKKKTKEQRKDTRAIWVSTEVRNKLKELADRNKRTIKAQLEVIADSIEISA